MRTRVAPALALALGVLLVGCGTEDESAGPAATSSTTTSSTTSTTTSTTTAAAADPAIVLASPDGVELRAADGSSAVVSEVPAAAAYGAEGGYVAFQDAEAAQRSFRPSPEGPVRVWSDGEVRDIPAGPGASRVELLDAAEIDGDPVALVAERISGAGPDDTFEELVRIDLRDLSRTVLVRGNAWESGHASGQLLPDGDVVGIQYAEANMSLLRWSAGEEEPVWLTPLGVDVPPVELLRGDGVHVVDEPSDAASVLRLRTFDAASGALEDEREVEPPDATEAALLECRSWLAPAQLACGRDGGSPVALRVEGGTEPIQGPARAVPVRVR